MNLNPLLEGLLNIAQKTKTDFALSIHMTPSGLSKLLGGKRLPPPQGRKAFTKQAADYFADAIYAPRCYTKFEPLFPVIYDFAAKDELHSFLSCAIELALDNDFTTENNINLDYAERSLSFLGRKSVLNLLCLILSDHLTSTSEAPLEIYTTLSLRENVFAKVLQRIRFIGLNNFQNITLNCFCHGEMLDALNGHGDGILPLIHKAERELGLDLNLWKTKSGPEQPFLLIKGSVLLLFNDQIGGIPLMIPVYHKGYLTIFYGQLMMQATEKISYSRADAIAFLKKNPQFIARLAEQGIESVYNFVSIGWLLEKEELKAAGIDAELCARIAELFDTILSTETTFIVSLTAMERFVASGKTMVPLFGAIDIPLEARAGYLQRLERFLPKKSFSKYKLVNSDLANMAVLCTRGTTLLYTVDDTHRREKIYVFKRNELRDFAKDIKLLSLTSDLWQTYRKELSFGHVAAK